MSFWKLLWSWYRATPPWAPRPAPLHVACPTYLARPAISTQWSNTSGTLVQEVKRWMWIIKTEMRDAGWGVLASRDGKKKKKVKAGAEAKQEKQQGRGWTGSPPSYFLPRPALHQLWSFHWQLLVEENVNRCECFLEGEREWVSETVGGICAFGDGVWGWKTFHCPKRTCARTRAPK